MVFSNPHFSMTARGPTPRTPLDRPTDVIVRPAVVPESFPEEQAVRYEEKMEVKAECQRQINEAVYRFMSLWPEEMGEKDFDEALDDAWEYFLKEPVEKAVQDVLKDASSSGGYETDEYDIWRQKVKDGVLCS